MDYTNTFRDLMGASALALVLATSGTLASAQTGTSCAQDPAACGGIEAGSLTSRDVSRAADPAGPLPAGDLGFAISLDGQQIAGDARMSDTLRRTDIALAQADVQVSYDGLGTTRRLSLALATRLQDPKAGETILLQSALNYPAYVTRGEIIVSAPDALGQSRIIARLPVAPNGQVAFTLPATLDGLTLRHRVYDAAGRFDETASLPLDMLRATPDAGDSSLAQRNIPTAGGAITVSGQNALPDSLVTVMGETIRTDAEGRFVLQRILPAGAQAVPVQIGTLALVRDITIPDNEVFATGVIDLTFGATRLAGEEWRGFDRGRLAFYVDGRRADGVTYRLSADTTPMPLRDLFARLDAQDPRNLLTRLDPRDVYPTFGDDSRIEDRTPTSGQIYARVQQAQNFLLWGDFRAGLDGNRFATNDRNLYGLQTHVETRAVTTAGEPRAALTLHAANAEELGQRDVLRATGGSYYQLSKSDITRGSETIWVQIRHATTGRIISARALQAGADYDLNPVQGGLMLRRPLASGSDEAAVYVVAQYEYRPTSSDIDGYVMGGRAESWLGDTLRLGLSLDQDDTAGRDHRLLAADALWQMSDGTWIKAEAAHSQGAGVDLAASVDGGLGFDTAADVRAGGTAYRVEMAADLADLGAQGRMGAYVEQRKAGFANGDIRVGTETGHEDFWGVNAALPLGETRQLTLTYDAYSAQSGAREALGAVMLRQDLGAGRALGFGLEHRDINEIDGDRGARLDGVLRYEHVAANQAGWWAFGTTMLDDSGLGRDDRIGFGGRAIFDHGWSAMGEVSTGTTGAEGRISLSRAQEDGATRYLGWEMEADRDIESVTRNGRDLGRFVTGAREQLTPRVAAYGETSYDIFGRYRTLGNAYGVDYDRGNGWGASLGLQFGTIRDGARHDFDRQGASVGVTRDSEDLQAGLRVEYRQESGLRQGRMQDSESWLVAGTSAYRLDDNARILASAEMMRNHGDSASLSGDYTDISVGYAYRPVDDNNLNLLARYRYLDDMIGQSIDGIDRDGPRQESHVLSLDALWRLDRNWTLGAKFGYRASQSAADAASAFARNDAYLAVASVKWHVVQNWDAQFELRMLESIQAETRDLGASASLYRHINANVMLGVGYNFGRFSDDLTDLVQDDQGLFVNLVTQF